MITQIEPHEASGYTWVVAGNNYDILGDFDARVFLIQQADTYDFSKKEY